MFGTVTRSIAMLIIVAALSGAAPATVPPGVTPALVSRSGNELSVSGFVLKETVEAVRRELAADDASSIDTLVVNIGGANIDGMIELGRIVRARQMSLRVAGQCTAPCANLLAPAAKRLVIPNGSYLGFGLAMGHVPASASPMVKKIVRHVGEQERDYFQQLGLERAEVNALGNSVAALRSTLGFEMKPVGLLIVPDVAFLRRCAGVASVEMPAYTVADSRRFAKALDRSRLAFLIDGKIYYDGKPVETFRPPCAAN